jgi:PKD repeat protein
MTNWFNPCHSPNRATFWQESFYNLEVNTLPLRANSAAMIAAMQELHSTGTYQNNRGRIRCIPDGTWKYDAGATTGYYVDRFPEGVDPTSPTPVVTGYRNWTLNDDAYKSSPMPQLWMPALRQQGATKNLFTGTYSAVGSGDRHAVMWAEEQRELVEAIDFTGVAPPTAGQVATFDLDSYELPVRLPGTPGAGLPLGVVAARVPVAPLLFSAADVEAAALVDGDLGHMLGVVVAMYRTGAPVWPARFTDGTLDSAAGYTFDLEDLPVCGQVFRLRSNFNLDRMPNAYSRVIARTLMTHGMILYDKSGVHSTIQAPNDPGWLTSPYNISISTNPAHDSLASPPLTNNFFWTDFEAVDLASVANPNPNSIQVVTPPPPDPPPDPGFVPAFPLDVPVGQVRWGVSFTSQAGVAAKWETPIGKPLAMYRRFFSWNNAVNGNMRTELLAHNAAGRGAWLSFKTPEVGVTSWADVAGGAYQIQVDAFLNGLRTTGINVWLTPFHEPENDPDFGTPAEWRAMVRYIETRRQAVGADNILIVPIIMDYTFNPASGRTVSDWVLPDPEFPLYGFDPYTNSFATNPSRITSTYFQVAIDTLKAAPYNKEVAIGECGGAIGTTNPRPPGLWEAFAQESIDNELKACCWFDVGTYDIVGAGTSADPDGSLYAAMLATFDSPTAYRDGLLFEAPPPPAGPTADAATASTAGLTVTFSAAGSTAGGAPITSYLWDFGDGTTSTSASPTHTYATAGSYTATLTVTDANGAADSDTVAVSLEDDSPPLVQTPLPSDIETYVQEIEFMHSAYNFDKILVWQDMAEIPNFASYIAFYNDFYDSFKVRSPQVGIYGPNITVSATFGADSDGPTATISISDEQFLIDFIDQASGLDGLAIAANVSDANWPTLVRSIRTIYNGPLLLRVLGTPTDPNPLHNALTNQDIVLWPSTRASTFANNPPATAGVWEFEGSFTTNSAVSNLSVRTNTLTNPLRGGDVSIEFYSGSTMVLSGTLAAPGSTVALGPIGVANTTTTYTYRISGRTGSPGSGVLNATISADSLASTTVSGSVMVVG